MLSTKKNKKRLPKGYKQEVQQVVVTKLNCKHSCMTYKRLYEIK